MGLKEIFSSLKSNSTTRRLKKSNRYNLHNCSLDNQDFFSLNSNSTATTTTATSKYHNQSLISFTNENSYLNTISFSSCHQNGLSPLTTTTSQNTLNRSLNDTSTSSSTRILIENHAKHVNSILDSQQQQQKNTPTMSIKNSPSCQSYSLKSPLTTANNKTISTTRSKIRTNPWIRSPSFHSTINTTPKQQLEQQRLINNQDLSSYSICNLCKTNICCKSCQSDSGISLTFPFNQQQKSPHTPPSTSSSSSYSRSSSTNIKDDYSILFEETLEKSNSNKNDENFLIAEVTSLFDKALSELPNYNNNNNESQELKTTLTSAQNDDECELEESVHELYRQIELLKEQKKLLDEKMKLAKQQQQDELTCINDQLNNPVEDVCKYIQEIRL